MRQAFVSLADSDVLIIDLHHNAGGSRDLVPIMCSYFFDQAAHLYDIVNPRPGEAVETWTENDIIGKKSTAKFLYILTSRSTYSAAECLAYSLQAMNKAVIVGEFSAGGAHPTRSFVIREVTVVLTVPVREVRSPITGTIWEGRGIEPDYPFPNIFFFRLSMISVLIQ